MNELKQTIAKVESNMMLEKKIVSDEIAMIKETLTSSEMIPFVLGGSVVLGFLVGKGLPKSTSKHFHTLMELGFLANKFLQANK